MDSHIAIPGLGQLESESTSTNSGPIVENTTKPDTDMMDTGDIHHELEPSAAKENKTTETGQIDEELQVYATTEYAQQTGETAPKDGAEDVKMQDTNGNAHENSEADEAGNSAATLEGQTEKTENTAVEAQAPEIAREASPPTSPRVTDALEAALDGLLGPVAEETAPDVAAPIPSKKVEQDPSKDAISEKVVPHSAADPAAGGADANPEWEVDSSPYASSSSSSSDDSSDDESEVEESKLGVEETARLLMEADGGSDDEMDGARAAKQAAGVRTKNEQPDEPEPKPEIRLEDGDTIAPLGIVQHIVEGTQVVIEALRDGTAVTILDRGTVLCKEDRSVLGVIHDTIATVHRPMYILKFRSDQEAKEAALERGTQIWYAKTHAKFVFPSQLRQEKGSDASNLHDEEVAPDEVEYSDDEQEQAHKREKKNRKRAKGKNNNNNNNNTNSRGDDHGSRAPTASGGGESKLNYDDDEDGPYKPLSRPANFGMGLPPPPPPGVAASPSHNGPRGGQHHQNNRRGGSGDSRGRGGGRGRGGRGGRGGGHGYNNHHQSPTPPQNNSSHQPPPPFAASQPPPPPVVPVPGQWPFPIPHMPQFNGIVPPPPPPAHNPGAPNPSYPMPSWGASAAQPNNPFPFPPMPPPNWPPNVGAQRPVPPQPSFTPPQAGGYGMPAPQYQPNGGAASPPVPAPNNYQYPHNYYGGGGQAQNGQPQPRWG